MRILIITQIVDRRDTFLGFFHEWIKAFSKEFDKTTVICLKSGEYELPNIDILSLGKESGSSRTKYLFRLLKYVWTRRDEYDAVFVHMNQEYILVCGWLWRLMGKKVFMWRNHHIGNKLTDIASIFCNNVFCTSRYSYTAKYKKTIFMPVGIDTEIFMRDLSIPRIPNSILYIGRISPIKKVDMLLKVLNEIHDSGQEFKALICGDNIPSDNKYVDDLKKFVLENNLQNVIVFKKGVPYSETVKLYNEYGICVNMSHSGMFDKTIFESMACEGIAISSNANLKGQINDDYVYEYADPVSLKEKILKNLTKIAQEKDQFGKKMREYTIQNHSLRSLAEKLRCNLSKA